MKNINNAMNVVMNQAKLQGMTFNPAIDCRNDLINLYGFSHSQVANMSDDEVFSFLDSLDDNSHFQTECKCSTCGAFLFEVDYSDHDDCYTLLCMSCNQELRLHYTSYDAWMDKIANAKQSI